MLQGHWLPFTICARDKKNALQMTMGSSFTASTRHLYSSISQEYYEPRL